MPRKKIAVVCGGAGFIGAHLCRRLLREGMRVICVDNFSTSSQENIRDLLRDRNFSFLCRDITRPLRIDTPIDYLLNFASPASPKDYWRQPIATLKVGSFGTYYTLELARHKKAVYLFASTSEVYGNPVVVPQPEDYFGNVDPVGERSCYDEAKRFSEALTMSYHRTYKMDTKIARIFNTYGEGMRCHDGRVIPSFMSHLCKRQPLVIYGDGQQTRSFCYISDLIEGIMRLLYAQVHTPVNLGNPQEMTIKQLAEKLMKITGIKVPIVYKKEPKKGDPRRRKPDITKARRLLGWRPKVKLEEGIRRTWQWFKEVCQS